MNKMEKKVISGILILLLTCVATLAFNIQPVESSREIGIAGSKAAGSVVMQETTSAVLLATLPFYGEMMFGPAEWSGAAVFTLSMSDFLSVPRIGDELTDHWYSGVTGWFDFTAENEPDFDYIVGALRNGEDNTVWLYIWCNDYGGGQGTSESGWEIGNPDLVGYDIAFIRLTVHSLLVSHIDTLTSVRHNCSWEIWGWLSADVGINPRVLNLRSQGKWIISFIRLPEGYNAKDVDVSSIRLNGSVPVDSSAPLAIGDCASSSVRDLMVKFDRAEVISYILSNVDLTELAEVWFRTVKLTITGRLNDGTPFEGSGEIRLIYKDVREMLVIAHVLRCERYIEQFLDMQT